MDIEIFTTGGTIDKLYFDAKSSFQVGEPQILNVLHEANITLEVQITPLLRKDSLEMTDADRQLIRQAVEATDAQRIVITHGTDTMIDTGKMLAGIAEKTIILTGAMQPARFRNSDAVFNIACAITAAQTLPAGVYIAMNGQIFSPQKARKNVTLNRFEHIGHEYENGNIMNPTNNDAGMPIAITLKPGTYYRCTCGKSQNLPFCDGSAHQGSAQLPIQFKISQQEKVYICSCGKSAKQPFCDGSCGVQVP